MLISRIAAAEPRDVEAKETPEKTDGQFAAVMDEIRDSAVEETKPVSEMSLEEYARRVRDAIAELPMSPSRALSCISVSISPEGLEAMRADPDYEKWVLEGLSADFAAEDPWAPFCGGHYTTHSFGATKEDYVGQSWYPEYMGGKGTAMYREKSAGCLWKKSAELSRSESDVYEKMRARLRLETYLKKIALRRSALQSEMLEQASMNRRMVEAMNRSGTRPVSTHTPVEFHGVPASELLSLLGGGFF